MCTTRRGSRASGARCRRRPTSLRPRACTSLAATRASRRQGRDRSAAAELPLALGARADATVDAAARGRGRRRPRLQRRADRQGGDGVAARSSSAIGGGAPLADPHRLVFRIAPEKAAGAEFRVELRTLARRVGSRAPPRGRRGRRGVRAAQRRFELRVCEFVRQSLSRVDQPFAAPSSRTSRRRRATSAAPTAACARRSARRRGSSRPRGAAAIKAGMAGRHRGRRASRAGARLARGSRAPVRRRVLSGPSARPREKRLEALAPPPPPPPRPRRRRRSSKLGRWTTRAPVARGVVCAPASSDRDALVGELRPRPSHAPPRSSASHASPPGGARAAAGAAAASRARRRSRFHATTAGPTGTVR